MAASPVVRAVRAARRRLVVQALLDRLAAGAAVALALGLAWFLVEPLLFASPPQSLRWVVLVALAVAATVAAIVFTLRRLPSRLATALELDSRFSLKERITTALGLPAELRSTPAGHAVEADAESHTRGLRVRAQFPIRLRRKAAWVPLLAGLLAVVAFLYHPVADYTARTARQQQEEAARAAEATRRTQDTRTKPKALPDRANRSPQVQELQDELARLEATARANSPAESQEKLTEITAAEEKAKAVEREKADRLTRLENKLAQLGKLTATEEFKDGPAKELNEALAQGDLERAEAAVGELAKQLRDPKLDPQKAEQARKQLDKMANELRRAANDQERQEKLKQLIEQAKAEGRDPSALEQELAQAQADAQKAKAIEQLADKLDAAKQSLQDGKPGEAAKQLDAAAKQIEGVKGEVQDLKDVQDQLKRLDELKAGAQAPGGMPNDGSGKPSDQTSGSGTASGSRPESAKTATASTDERQRTPFDPKGRKNYGGAVVGSGFRKQSPSELGPAIEQAVQDAPDAVAGQPLSRDDKDAVKEFYRDFPKK